ncbi:hypothetical protein DVJ83_14440 (plasmid) [Deinococcus wulumuqiensis]|uniref:Uncharacterized protein n=1 Tax=Deinococcus wulumuqiensis TaxID=980427 RepID=A0A345IKZ8_9DEIO|nr:hypothetical protein DVJ83_14440 [Deinococcus wulumuqiensis]
MRSGFGPLAQHGPELRHQPAALAAQHAVGGTGGRLAQLCCGNTFDQTGVETCRNMLIYFSLELQKQVFAIFHYALRRGANP